MALDLTTRILVLSGAEDFLRSEYVKRLEAAITEAHGDFERFDFDGASTEASVVLDELRSYGLMQRHKLVVVDNADKFLASGEGAGGARHLLEVYAAAPMSEATLVLRSTRWNRGKLDTLIAKVGEIIKCDEATSSQAAAWCVERAKKRLDATLDRDAALLLVDRVGTKLARLDSELGKLASASRVDPPVIDREVVVELVGRSREEDAWEIQAAILSGHAAKALATLRSLRSIARISEVLIMWAMLDLARKVNDAAALLASGAPPRSVAKEVGIWGASEGPVLATAQRLGPTRAAGLLHAVMDGAEGLRMGRRGGPDRTLEALTVQMADTVA
jgi:DNA polymerase III delta subunit